MKIRLFRRRGITILEVIIAMGISIFGLLAVMALVPFAARRARSGLEIEEGAQVAQRALGDFHAHDMGNPEKWVVWSPLPIPPTINAGVNRYVNMPSYFEPTNLPTPLPPDFTSPNVRWFFDEAVLIDPQFFAVNREVTQFPYCYESVVGAPPGFVDDETGLADTYRDPLFDGADLPPPGFTSWDSKAPGVRRISLMSSRSTAAITLPMDFVMARQVFETSDDIALRPLDPAEEIAVPEFEFKRTQYFEGTDPISGNPVPTKVLSYGQTSWLAMLVPENANRTTWKLFIIVVRDRDPSFDMNLTNERVARIRGGGTGATPNADAGFLSMDGNRVSRRGGLVRMESWGTTRLVSSGTQPVPNDPVWLTMEKDLVIAPNQWVLLAQWGPNRERRYQWYRVLDASANTELGPVDAVPFNGGGLGGVAPPARMVTLLGPDWDARFDTLVYMMDNVVAVYERTIEMPSNSFPQPQNHPWSP